MTPLLKEQGSMSELYLVIFLECTYIVLDLFGPFKPDLTLVPTFGPKSAMSRELPKICGERVWVPYQTEVGLQHSNLQCYVSCLPTHTISWDTTHGRSWHSSDEPWFVEKQTKYKNVGIRSFEKKRCTSYEPLVSDFDCFVVVFWAFTWCCGSGGLSLLWRIATFLRTQSSLCSLQPLGEGRGQCCYHCLHCVPVSPHLVLQ